MAYRVFIKPRLEAKIELWNADWRTGKLSNIPKYKLMDIHPVWSLVLLADQEGRICVWDYGLRSAVLNTSLVSLIGACSRQEVRTLHTVLPSAGNRLSQRSNVRSSGHVPQKSGGGVGKSNAPLPMSGPAIAKVKQQLGSVLSVSFADASYALSCAGLAGHRPPEGERTAFLPQGASDTRVAVVCEGALVLHDYGTGQTTLLSSAQLGKATPTCVECCCPSVLAVGCSDGLIRIWDAYAVDFGSSVGTGSYSKYDAPKQEEGAGTLPFAPPPGALVLTLQTHSKGDVKVIKSLPVKSSPGKFPDKLRFLSISVDGQALVWELPLRAGRLHIPGAQGTGISSILPVARVAESLGGGAHRHQVALDPETNLLHACCGEKQIRVWDLEDLSVGAQGKSSRLSTSTPKRGLLGAVQEPFAGVAQVAVLTGHSCLVADKKSSAYSRLASLALLHHPYFSAGCYITHNKGVFGVLQDRGASDEASSEASSVAGGPAGKERTLGLHLLHEFSLQALLERHLRELEEGGILDSPLLGTTVAPPPALKEELLEAAGRATIFAVRPHPAHPHVLAVASSIGLFMITVAAGNAGAGPLVGSHPLWGPVKLMCTEEGTVQKVLLAVVDDERSEGNGVGGGWSRGREDAAALPVAVEVLEECPSLEFASTRINAQTSLSSVGTGTAASPPGGVSRRRSLVKRAAAAGGAQTAGGRSCRPLFLPSPSGSYCAILWPESMAYVVTEMNLDMGDGVGDGGVDGEGEGFRVSRRLLEVDRGKCLDFGWVGTSDHYLIKTPTMISSLGSNKPRRSSLVNMVMGLQKDRYLLQPAQLVLKQCRQTVVAGHAQTTVADVPLLLPPGEMKMDEGSAVATPQLAPDLISGLFGGPLLAVNVLNSREADALIAEKAQARRAAVAAEEATRTGPGGPGGGPGGGLAGPPRTPAAEDPTGVRVITDLDETEEAIRAQLPPAPSAQVTVFLTLVSARWVKKMVAEKAAAAAAVLAQKEKEKGGKKVRKANASAVALEEGGDAGDAEVMQLVAVGPAMQTAETVRWDLERDLMAVKLVGSNVINILQMQLEVEGGLHLHLQTLASVDLGAPSSPLHRPLTAMHWSRGVLFVTAPTAAAVKAIVCYPAEEGTSAASLGLVSLPASDQGFFVDTFDLDYFSPFLSSSGEGPGFLRSFNPHPLRNPVPVCEAVGLHGSVVMLSTRDGTVQGLRLRGYPALAAALLLLAATEGQLGTTQRDASEALRWLPAMSPVDQERFLRVMLHRRLLLPDKLLRTLPHGGEVGGVALRDMVIHCAIQSES
ncbi:hypothetical protein B484DRAFT_453896 [Ochromonadaceae sp. CCMP2298]|nr:hypothetical protein B484DRAFT_453896 [Ochromonadaceae sp. CCMP2298]